MADSSPQPVHRDGADLRHNYALDGIRGLAILMVLARHLIWINAEATTPIYVVARAIRDSLFSGVDIFFALSGFLITRILVNTVADRHFFRSFYARRALRIFPLYYGILLVVFAFTPVYHIHWGGQQWRLLTYSNRLFQSRQGPPFNFYFGNRINLVNFWSLHIEEQFYMLWPLFVFFLRTPRRLLYAAGITSVASLGVRLWMSFHGFSADFIYTSLISRTDSLLIGASLALALRTRLHALALKIATPLFFAGAVLFAFFVCLQQLPATQANRTLFPLEFTFLGLASTGLIAMCLKPRSRAASLFRSPVLRFFGKYSYGLYIFHSVLPMFYEQRLVNFTNAHIPPFLANLTASAVEFVVALAASLLSYRYWEMPFLKLKRHFSPSVESPPQVQPGIIPASS